MIARPAYAAAGLALLGLIWAPLDALAPRFPLHMLRHMVLVALAAPLLVLGFPRLGQVMAMPALLAAGLEFLLVWGWHLPAAHGAAFRGGLVFVLEQATFLIAGLFVWAGCLHGPRLIGAVGLLLTSMHMTLLGALLTLAPRDLYAFYCGTAPDPDGQALGGMLMLAIGTPVYLLGGVALAGQALSDPKVKA